MMMINVFLDVESIPGSQWYLDKLMLDVQPPSNYRDPEAIMRWWESTGNAKREEAYKVSALSPFNKLCCICYAIGDGPIVKLYDTNEELLLINFTQRLRKDLTEPLKGFCNPRYVGHNALGFDLPRLFQRCLVNGIDPDIVRIKSPALMKPWDDGVFDTMAVWCGRDYKGNSLANLCREFGIEDKCPDMDGSKVWPLYQEGRLACIADYCAEDVRLVRELAKRMGLGHE